MNPFDVIVTVSDRVATPDMLRGFMARGATMLRINAAHASPVDIARLLQVIRRAVGRQAKILVDVAGTKVRTAALAKPLDVEPGKPLVLKAAQLNYPEVLSVLQAGHVLVAADGTLRFRVMACDDHQVHLMSETKGTLENNKGVHFVGIRTPLPFLSSRDLDVLQVAQAHEADFVGLSFVRRPEDVVQARQLLEGSGVRIICKIETQDACDQLSAILPLTSHVLVDRGDLSSEIGMLQIAHMERLIAEQARQHDVKVFVATQLLAHMVEHSIPSTTEVVAMYALMDYADGIQLSDEITIGQHPFEALDVVRKIRASAVRPERERLTQ